MKRSPEPQAEEPAIAETPTRFSSVELNVEAQGSSEEIERLVAIADKGVRHIRVPRADGGEKGAHEAAAYGCEK